MPVKAICSDVAAFKKKKKKTGDLCDPQIRSILSQTSTFVNFLLLFFLPSYEVLILVGHKEGGF